MQTIYTVDYLNGLTMEKLYNIAKEYPFFNMSDIDKKYNFPNSCAYNVLTNNRTGSMYAAQIKDYLADFIFRAQTYENIQTYDLYKEATKYKKLTYRQIADDLNCTSDLVSKMINNNLNSYKILELKEYLDRVAQERSINRKSKEEYIERILNPKHFSSNLNLQKLLDKAREYQSLPLTKIANDLNCHPSTVSSSIKGQINGRIAYEIKEYLEKIICLHQRSYKAAQMNEYNNQKEQTQEHTEVEEMTEETLTDTKEMKTYDEFLNFINTQKELPIVKKALDETLSENQNLDKILAKEEFITIETAQELNEKLFANEYTEEEILDFENQYFGTIDNASLKDKIKSFVEKHNLSLETALKLLQISEEDYKKMLEGADKVSNKTADKIYKAISAFDEFYRSEKTQDTINNTKNTFVTGFAIASAKSQTFLNKGLNKFADFLNKSADKIKNSNSENKED